SSWSAPSPACFLDARNEAVAGHAAEANAANAELAIYGPWPAAQPAAQANADAVARPQLRFGRLALGLVRRGQIPNEFHRFGFCGHIYSLYASRNGMPKRRSSSRASSSLLVLVTKVTSMPWVNVTLSGSISGNTICSDNPRL